MIFYSVKMKGFIGFISELTTTPKEYDQLDAEIPDLQALKAAIEDVSGATKIPPARILVLWRSQGDQSVTPDLYEFLPRESARVKIRGSTFVCSLELAMERDDGTYDFIPVVVEPVMAGVGSPASA